MDISYNGYLCFVIIKLSVNENSENSGNCTSYFNIIVLYLYVLQSSVFSEIIDNIGLSG